MEKVAVVTFLDGGPEYHYLIPQHLHNTEIEPGMYAIVSVQKGTLQKVNDSVVQIRKIIDKKDSKWKDREFSFIIGVVDATVFYRWLEAQK